MDQSTWDAVDAYIGEIAVHEDDALRQAAIDSDAAGLPSIAVMPAHGKLLHIFARMIGARRILEVGTLGGYSAIWMARALLADGRLVSLEISEKHAEVARRNLERAGIGDRVEIIVAPAIETLSMLEEPFDMVFIDADKESTLDYFSHALRLTHSGSLIIVDNVVRVGQVIDAASDNTMVQGIRRFNEALKNESRVTATTIQTVGTKGYDGFTICLVN